MSGLDPLHLLEMAVRPTLRAMGPEYSGPAAEMLVLGTAAVESHFVWLRQHNHGPALGLWQLEPFTFRDLVQRCPSALMYKIAQVTNTSAVLLVTPEIAAWNLRFGAAMCRLKYRDDPEPLPLAGNIHALADTWKRSYNSRLGAGKPEDFERAWADLVAPSSERMWP